MRKMRRISGSFWTPERDARLRYLEAEGFSAAKIAEKLGTSRGAVPGRLHRLSGATLTYPSYIRQEKEARARAAARTKERTRLESTVIPRLSRRLRAESVVTGRLRGHGRRARRLGQSGMRSGFRKSGCDRLLRASCEKKTRHRTARLARRLARGSWSARASSYHRSTAACHYCCC